MKNKDTQENCLIILEELIANQTSYLEGYESRVFDVLIDCRSDGSCEVRLCFSN
jgi:hypothetical protein